MPGILRLETAHHGRAVQATRDAGVPDDFWRKLRAEWGQSGSQPNQSIVAPLETFARRTSWIPVACRTYSVKVLNDDFVRSILRTGVDDRSQLEALQNGLASTDDAAAAIDLLNHTRFKRDLKPFQIRDLSKMLRLRHGANFSVPGAGKTSVELAIYEIERHEGRILQLLVVGPLSSFDSWIDDSKDCLDPTPNICRYTGGSIPSTAEIVLVNYQRLSISYERLASWVTGKPTLVVLDEAHRMKRGRDGEWGDACLDLAYLAKRRDLLTGTPAPQSPRDLVALFDFIWPGSSRQILPAAALSPHPSNDDVALISPSIAPLFVRTTKSELELPSTTMNVVTVPMGPLHKEIYESLKANFSKLIKTQKERVDLAAWGNVTMYLLEAATNPALLPAGSSTSDPIEFRHPPMLIPPGSNLNDLISDFASYETPEKFKQLALLVADLKAQGRKVLIWSNFVRNLLSLERMFHAYNPALIHGGIPSEVSSPTSGRTREGEIARFKNDESCAILLANPAALGEGVSLHHICHDAIYLERTFNAGQYLQSVDRIHRLGLAIDQVTTVTFLVSAGTIDLAVSRRVQEKAIQLGVMLDDPSIELMSLPDDDEVGPPIDVSDDGDLVALFAHLRGEPSEFIE